MSVVRVGSNKQFADNWENIFGGTSKKSAKKATVASKSTAKKKAKSKKSPAKKSAKRK